MAILSLTDLRHITLIKIYTDYFDQENIPYDIICTSRYEDGNNSYRNADVYSYKASSVSDSKIKKLLKYIEFRNYAIKVLKENNYKFTIVWGEHTAVIFSDYLSNHGHYCVNIRDVGFWKFPFYWKRLTQAVKSSDFSTWCAPRGVELLPPKDYVIVLNQNKELVSNARIEHSLVKTGNKLRIGVVGYIRHVEPTKKLMNVLKNDERFIVQLFGTGAEELAEYAKEIGMINIEIEGTFTPDKTAELLDRIDVINCYCGDGAVDNTIALGTPIRYGYSTCLYKPAIVSPNTYISDRTNELNIAFTINDMDTFGDDFYDWYYSLNFDEFKTGCEEFNRAFEESEIKLHKVCDKIIKPLFYEDKV